LRKLAASSYRENLILKEGLFIYTLTNFESRSTVDVDFLMKGLNNDIQHMDEIIQEILEVSTGNDYMIFNAGKSEPIALHRKYHGVSTQITGRIKNIRVPFNVDIGVGDIDKPCCFLTENGACEIEKCQPEGCRDYSFTNKPERLLSLRKIIRIKAIG
jgi:Fe-S-cluster containining protein